MKSATELLQASIRLRNSSLGAGGVASLLVFAGAFLNRRLFISAYLVAFLFWWSISSGCLALAMLHQLTGGGWGLSIRRLLEASYSTFAVLALAFIPLVLALPDLYPWARPETLAQDPVLQFKARYLNPQFFEIRAAAYFIIWLACGWCLTRLSRPRSLALRRESEHQSGYSGFGLILWSLTVTFAAIDWGMSLEPHWVSSIYGVIFMAGHALSAMSFAILALVLLQDFSPIARVLTKPRLHDLGNLMLTFTLFWTYVSFTQYLVIWSGNLPEEATWYQRRAHGGWQLVALSLIGLNFAAPFTLLLSRSLKQHPRRLAAVAVLLLLMRLVELSWQVLPPLWPDVGYGILLCPLTCVALGGFWIAAFASRLSGCAASLIDDLKQERERHAGSVAGPVG